jgi:hypothetical protein
VNPKKATHHRGGGAFFTAQSIVAPQPMRAAPAVKFRDEGGRVLGNGQVQLIFWGNDWNRVPVATPSSAHIISALQTILGSKYMSRLHYYRSTIGPGSFTGSQIVSGPLDSGGTQSPADPPSSFTNADVETLISNLVQTHKVPGPDENSNVLYCVVLPRGIYSTGTDFDGEHFAGDIVGHTAKAPIAWLTNNGAAGKELDFVTSIFSHELVESCSDPEGNAIVGLAGTCHQEGWCEIADVTEETGRIGGVLVQAYWSDHDRKAVIPGQTPS